MCGWKQSMSCLRKWESSTVAENGSRRNLFASCPVDPSGALKFIKQDMDKVMEH